MKRATLADLEREYWLRMRNKGEIVWKTATGNEISIDDMTDEHLKNTINMLHRKKAYEREMEEMEYMYRELEENASDDVLYAGWD